MPQLDQFKEIMGLLTKYMIGRGCHLHPLPKVILTHGNSMDIFDPTGYYDPAAKQVVLYINGRHPKDVLRSYAHELIHHDQNMRGLMPNNIGTTPMYAQQDPRLRQLEKDAFLRGNMLFRDFTDNYKYNSTTLAEDLLNNTFEVGDTVININPNCPQRGSIGRIQAIIDGEILYRAINNGPTWEKGFLIRKTPDQLTHYIGNIKPKA